MVEILEVKNFKSIKDLKLNCKRFNIFIGEPNSGKSNILETVGIFSFADYCRYCGQSLKDFTRFETMGNLFYDEELDNAIEIRFDSQTLKIEFKNQRFRGQSIEN